VIVEIRTDLPLPVWDRFVAAHPRAHVLQTAPWGELKTAFGWTAQRAALLADGEPLAGAQILYRRLPGGVGRLAYVPCGPLVNWDDGAAARFLLDGLAATARSAGALALTIEPDLPDTPANRDQLRAMGFVPSPLGSVQPRRTILVDISGDEPALLAAMKQKTRYNIGLAERKGVTVRAGTEADLPALSRLMAETAARDGFAVHAPAYYDLAYRLFIPRGWAQLLVAEAAGETVAGLMVFALGRRAWYFYGASGDAHREKMPNYLLQWEAMRWARSLGCVEYDLWGVPDADEEQLEAEFERRRDGLWGVYRFKRGFGGRLVRTVGAWDRPLRSLLYRLYVAAVHVANRSDV